MYLISPTFFIFYRIHLKYCDLSSKKIPNDFEPATQELLTTLITIIEDTKGIDTVVIDVRNTGLDVLFDSIIISTANSSRHADAIAEKIRLALKKTDADPVGFEGAGETGWSLIDAGRIVVHIMSAEAREHYDLEGLWGMETPS